MFAHFRAHSLYRHKFLTFSAHCAKQQVIAQLRGVISSISLTLKHVCFICFYSLRACANCLSCMYVCLCFYVYFFFFLLWKLCWLPCQLQWNFTNSSYIFEQRKQIVCQSSWQLLWILVFMCIVFVEVAKG